MGRGAGQGVGDPLPPAFNYGVVERGGGRESRQALRVCVAGGSRAQWMSSPGTRSLSDTAGSFELGGEGATRPGWGVGAVSCQLLLR